MPLQNRVDPFGTLFRTPARGTLMGNRGGVIHNPNQEIVRPFKSRRWIACVLEFRGRHREVMTPNLYTELFFLDEAVALAAGHRPCAECRRPRYNAFRAAWSTPLPSADDMDLVLHPARIDPAGRKVTYRAPLRSLPSGAFIELDAEPWLIAGQALHLWTPQGYTHRQSSPDHATVTVLTPRPTVACLLAGYVPELASPAGALRS